MIPPIFLSMATVMSKCSACILYCIYGIIMFTIQINTFTWTRSGPLYFPISVPIRICSATVLSMALPMLVGGADCGPINPLQGLSKNFDQDRGIQQARVLVLPSCHRAHLVHITGSIHRPCWAFQRGVPTRGLINSHLLLIHRTSDFPNAAALETGRQRCSQVLLKQPRWPYVL